jgi:hypothetical protein
MSPGATAPAPPRPPSVDRPSAVRAILWAWAVAGTLDILSAVVLTVLREGSVMKMLQGIASGLLGPKALEGGFATTGLGLALHYLIALGAVVTFWAASRKLPWLLDHAVISGLLYGLAVWLFMNGVVLPLAFPQFHFPPPARSMATQIPIHLVLLGLPIALIVRRFSRGRAA